MRLQLVTGKLCFVRCYKCGESTAIGDGAEQFRNSPGMADLNGEPFKAYYCATCIERDRVNGLVAYATGRRWDGTNAIDDYRKTRLGGPNDREARA